MECLLSDQFVGPVLLAIGNSQEINTGRKENGSASVGMAGIDRLLQGIRIHGFPISLCSEIFHLKVWQLCILTLYC